MIDRRGITLCDFYLRRNRIRLYINPTRNAQVFLTDFLRSRHIQENIRLAVCPLQLEIRQPPGAIIRVAAKAPADSKSLQLWRNRRDIGRGIGGEVVASRVIYISSRIFDVADVVAQSFEPDEVMNKLPENSPQRIPEGDARDDDFPLVHAPSRRPSRKARGKELVSSSVRTGSSLA